MRRMLFASFNWKMGDCGSALQSSRAALHLRL